MDESRCIFCDTESNDVVIEENGYEGRKCPQCGLIYISPRPSFDEVVNLYGHDSAHVSAQSHISAAFFSRLYARHHLRIVRSFAKGGALLEIGAGGGYFLDEARKLGFDPHAVELNPIQAEHIRNTLRIPCDQSPVDASIFGGKQFDVVYHCDVISHFFDPISDFKKINQIMKEGAFLIFETGNLGEVDQTYFKYFERFQYPDHLFFFSTDNLADLLERTGFEPVKMYRYSVLPQLKAEKALSGIKNSIQNRLFKSSEKKMRSSDGAGVSIKPAANSRSLGAKSLVREVMRNSYQYFNFILRYKIGRIGPKANRPQTVIIVARKTKKGYPSDSGELKKRRT